MFRREAVTRRRVAAALALAGALSQPALIAQPSAPPVPIGISLDTTDARLDVMRATADDAMARYTEWLGPPPFDRVTIVDRLGPAPGDGSVDVPVDQPWLAPPLLMQLESHVAYGVAMGWLSGVRAPNDRVPIDQALAWYLQSRIVERQFNLRVGVPAYRSESVAMFGGLIQRPQPSLRLSRWTAGLGRDVLLHEPASSERTWPRLPAAMSPSAVRGALAFGTLERWLGWPALQSGLAALVQRSRERALSSRDAVDVLSAAIGQDLWWFFEQVLDPSRVFDYAIERVDVPGGGQCDPAPCSRTEVAAVRRGSGTFSGIGRQPIGAFEAGDALELRIEFEDGQQNRVRWDGRAERRTFAFDSTTPPRRVSLDPDRLLLLNTGALDTSRHLVPHTNVPLGKWVARWTVWLQDAALAYSSLL